VDSGSIGYELRLGSIGKRAFQSVNELLVDDLCLSKRLVSKFGRLD
jgi:hypothetical protein